MFSSSASKSLFVEPNLDSIIHDSFEQFEKYGFSLMEHGDYEILEKELEGEFGMKQFLN